MFLQMHPDDKGEGHSGGVGCSCLGRNFGDSEFSIPFCQIRLEAAASSKVEGEFWWRNFLAMIHLTILYSAICLGVCSVLLETIYFILWCIWTPHARCQSYSMNSTCMDQRTSCSALYNGVDTYGPNDKMLCMVWWHWAYSMDSNSTRIH
jgi:hypothetical protein